MNVSTKMVALCCLAFGLGIPRLAAQDLGGPLKENLDLPYSSVGDPDDDDDDRPEIVTFYGQNLEGDGFFYCIDRSSSMAVATGLPRAKREIARNVSELSSRAQFGIVFFDAAILKFPSSGQPLAASPGYKSAALVWLGSVGIGSGSCILEGLGQSLRMANLASVKRKVLVYAGDGGGTCGGPSESEYLENALTTITSQNYQRVQINCIGVNMGTGRSMQESFLKRLAAANRGTYRRI